MTEYPQTKRIEIDDWIIITDGLVKGLYHACGKSNWRTWVGDWICPGCKTEVPKDVDSIYSLLNDH